MDPYASPKATKSNPSPPDFSYRKTAIGPVSCFSEAIYFLGDQFWTFLGISLVGLLIAGAVPLVLMGPMYCGIGLVLFQRVAGRPIEFDQLFKGFDYFLDSLIVILLYVALIFCCALPLIVLVPTGLALIFSGQGVFVVVGCVLLVFCYVGWILASMASTVIPIFACFLIVDRQMKGVDAFQLALRGCWANWPGLLGLTLLGQLMVWIGMMLCVIPGFLAMPIVIAAQFIAFRKIFGIAGGSWKKFAPPEPPFGGSAWESNPPVI